MKRQNQGFTLVELIVTFTLVSTISFLLFQLIFGLKEIYISTKFKTNLLTKQANLTRRINNDLLNYKIIKFDNCAPGDKNAGLCIEFTFADEEEKLIKKRLQVQEEQIVYDNYKIIVKKSADGSSIGDINIKNTFLNSSIYLYNSILKIDVPITNSIAEGDYGLHLTIQYSNIPSSLNDTGQVFTESFKDLVDKETEIVITSVSINDLLKSVVTSNDGLYELSYSPKWYTDLTSSERKKLPKYVYRGENPKNHVLIKNQCYRILHITEGNVIKLIYEGKSNGDSCELDEQENGFINVAEALTIWGEKNNKWSNSEIQNIRTTINDWYAETNFTSRRMGTFTNKLGMISASKIEGTDNIQGILSDELNSLGSYEKVSLPNVSDYLLSTTNTDSCNSIKEASETTNCATNNFLYKNEYNYWTVTGVDGTNNQVWSIQKDGKIRPTTITTNTLKVRPVIFLKSTTTFSGTGIAVDPYRLK